MSNATAAFSVALMRELVASTTRWHDATNWDAERFGPYSPSLASRFISWLNRLLEGRLAIIPADVSLQTDRIADLEQSLSELSCAFDLLEDAHSRSTMVKVVAYHVMGHKKVRLPLSTREYWSERRAMRSLVKGQDRIRLSFRDWNLELLDLTPIGYPIQLFILPGAALNTFRLRQYEYRRAVTKIVAQSGDYVIDAGGCWGDTALFFAHSVGEAGRVFTFEFVPEHLEVIQKNLALNPALAPRIEVVGKAVWHKSDEEIQYKLGGPGSSLRATGEEASGRFAATLSIDDFVKRRGLRRVDYIKMDIEGAELDALRGSEETLRRYKPSLAISAYHRKRDLIDLPQYLLSLGLGYRFFLDHFTIYGEETVLFATVSTVHT